MSDRHAIPPYSLRMPQELRDRLESVAKANHRSLNAEILARLESTLAEQNRALDTDLAEFAEEMFAAADAEATAAQAPELARRMSAVEHQLQQIIGLLKKA